MYKTFYNFGYYFYWVLYSQMFFMLPGVKLIQYNYLSEFEVYMLDVLILYLISVYLLKRIIIYDNKIVFTYLTRFFSREISIEYEKIRRISHINSITSGANDEMRIYLQNKKLPFFFVLPKSFMKKKNRITKLEFLDFFSNKGISCTSNTIEKYMKKNNELN